MNLLTKLKGSFWMPTQPGVLYFTKELAGPLVPEVN